MKPANNGPLYASGIYPKMAEIFREHGWALAIHGSVISDFDLIAAPWILYAAAPEIVVWAVINRLAVTELRSDRIGVVKPHGRRAWKLHMSFGDVALDVSFMPRWMDDESKTGRALALAVEFLHRYDNWLGLRDVKGGVHLDHTGDDQPIDADEVLLAIERERKE